MPEVPADAPDECPGTSSGDAGKASACVGCPNQTACSSGALQRGPDPDIAEIKARLSTIKYKVLILSGKGGVGKSTLSAGLTYALAQDASMHLALLDLDICGPSQPCIMGCLGEQIHNSGSGWSPVYVEENICVMSVGFLLKSPDDAVVWRGPKKNGLIKQFFRDVDWGSVDVMIIDTPPGTSDEHLSVVQYLKSSGGLDGAVIVTTPQEVALADVRKEINFCRKVGVPILGVVENMSSFVCPNCSHESALFPPTTGGAEAMCSAMNLPPPLARLPLDPQLTRLCDMGRNPFKNIEEEDESETALNGLPKNAPVRIALEKLAANLMTILTNKNAAVDAETGES